MTLKTSSRAGDFSRNIRVSTNDPQNPVVQLTCKAKTLVAFTTEPTTANFGKIARDAAAMTKTVKLTRGDGGPLSPTVVPPKEKNFSAQLREIEPGQVYELDVTVSPPWPNERLSGSITVQTGLEEVPTETVRIFGQLEPRLKAEPSRFVVASTVSTDTELKVRLVWSGEPAKVLRVTSNDATLNAEVREEEGQQYIVLHVPAGYERSPKTTTNVMVYTDDAIAGTLRIPISGTAAGASATARPATMAPAPAGQSRAAGRAAGATSRPER